MPWDGWMDGWMLLPLKVMSLLVASDKLSKVGVCEERSCEGSGEIQAQLLVSCDLVERA